MCEVLLVQPRYEKFGEASVYPTSPPLGLGYMAAVLREDKFDVCVLDLNVESRSKKQDLEKILRLNPEIIGISVNTPSLPTVYGITTGLRNRGFGGEIIFGGPHITARPESLMYLDGLFGFKGEGEVGLNMLCNFLVRGEGKEEDIVNLVINNKRGVRINKEEHIENLESLPPPARDLFKTQKYRFIHLICSRGCPYKCSYCSVANTKYRARSPKKIVDELNFITRTYPSASVGFSDDVFTLDKKLVEEICREIKKRKLKGRWSCTTRADLADKKLLEDMYNAGCWHISFGVESGVEEIRYSLGKRITNEQYTVVFDLCKKIGLKTRAYVMFGHLNEKERDMFETIKFIKKLKPSDAFFSLTSIYPNTLIAKHALIEGRISKNIWEENMIKGFGAPIYTPEGLTLEDMKVILYAALKEFYLTPTGVLKRIVQARSIAELKQGLDFFYGFIVNTLSI